MDAYSLAELTVCNDRTTISSQPLALRLPSTNQQRPVGTEGVARLRARLTSFDNLVENRRASVPDISIRDFRSNASERANANYTPPRNASANHPANTDLRNELSSRAARLESNFRNNIPQRPLSSGNVPSARPASTLLRETQAHPPTTLAEDLTLSVLRILVAPLALTDRPDRRRETCPQIIWNQPDHRQVPIECPDLRFKY